MVGVERIGAAAARAALALLRRANLGGLMTIEGTAPPGAGCGASTLAALSAVRAVAAATGARFTPEEEAALCLAVEGATDPLMFSEPGALLWASREGRILERLPAPPALAALGVFDGPGRRTDPAVADFADIADLAAALRAAFAAGDLAAIGGIATESARRNGLDRISPRFEAVAALGAETGALGLAAAHTGSALALLFAPDAPGRMRAEDGLAALGFAPILRFATG